MTQTKIMAIINITPDSFYSKSCVQQIDLVLEQARQIIEQGADYLDIGGCSTRPGARAVSIEEEIERVLPVIIELKKNFSIPLSIDTFHYQVAQKAIEAGATFINDITGLTDPNMRKLVIDSKLPCCIMQMQGTPQTMQVNPSYPGGVISEIKNWLGAQVELFLQEGGQESQIYLDPGIGFGKTVEHNLQLLQELEKLQELGYPLLLGTSRKSFIQKITHRSADEALPGTLVVNTLLIQKKVDILRVHDVAEHRDLIRIMDALEETKINA